jgi:CRISPR system Cascade subunit CasE
MAQLFLSKVVLGFSRNDGAETGRGATRPYVVHQLVADLFGDYQERPYLFRVEDAAGSSQEVLILSSREPSPPIDVPARATGTVREVHSKPFTLTVPPGTPLDFEIRLNATKDLPRDGKRSRRVDVWEAVWRKDKDTALSPHEVYGAYLERKLGAGATLRSARLTARGMVRARRNLGSRPITFVATNLVGTLEVRESARLIGTVASGIGRSKAFGCGMLCLSRPGTVLPRRHPEIASTLY